MPREHTLPADNALELEAVFARKANRARVLLVRLPLHTPEAEPALAREAQRVLREERDGSGGDALALERGDADERADLGAEVRGGGVEVAADACERQRG